MHTTAAPAGADDRRILFISYHFPPSASVGGQRMVNFASCLAQMGHQAHVLTIREQDIEQIDRGRLAGLDSLTVHRTAVRPTALKRLASVKMGLRRWLGRPQPGAPAPADPFAQSGRSGRESTSHRLRRYALSFVVLPDFERGWIRSAAWKAIRLIRAERLDWFVTSCPPYSAHVVGLIVKLATGTRWVADFRDPWMTTGSKRLYPTSAASLTIERWLEKKVMEKADLVVFNVERLRNAYRERYAHVPAEKFLFIPNGIAVRSQSAGPSSKYERFTLSYTGAMYVGRSPEPVFAAVARLIERGVVSPERICIKLVGQCRMIQGTPTAALVARYGLENVVEVIDSVPHAEALDITRRSHLALLFAPNLPYQIPAKVYDYLGAGTRILAIAEDGGTADIVRQTESGRAFTPSDVDAIAAFIQEEMASPPASLDRRSAALARFDVRRITGELVAGMRRVEAGTEWSPR
jgi:glycosyltransferase involved in cell wall biosynthesis